MVILWYMSKKNMVLPTHLLLVLSIFPPVYIYTFILFQGFFKYLENKLIYKPN